MKRNHLVLTAAAVFALTLALLPAQQTVSADDSKAVLEETMAVLGSNYRQVRRQARDASKNADTAEKLAEMIDASVRAKAALPDTATSDELKNNYRVIMNKMIIVLAQAENAALAGEQRKLQDLVKEANMVKGEGHQMFLPE